MSVTRANDLPSLQALLVARFPDLAGAAFTLRTQGFDSLAVDVDDRLIFKFPRYDYAAQALRKEAALLEVVRQRVTLPVPALELFEEPTLFSRHTKLTGEHLWSADYEKLGPATRDRLADDIARFYSELHALDADALRKGGAVEREPWFPAQEILRQAWPALSAQSRRHAQATLTEWQALEPDPQGTVYGFFDGHGWNMAFDPDQQKLNGIYDFADSGFGDRHVEFIYTSFISLDLTARVIAAYPRHSGRIIDVERVHLLTGVFWLSEIGGYADQPKLLADALKYWETWKSAHPGDLSSAGPP